MKILLIKLGGSILNHLHESFFSSLRDLQNDGYRLIFVHGGGPDIDWMLEKMEIASEFHRGLRKTTPEVLNVVELVLSGKTNRRLVSMLQRHGFRAIGLHGSDAHLLEGKYIDQHGLGEVGEITSVNCKMITDILQLDLIPVLTPLALSQSGTTLNVNADMAAGAIAKAMNAESCIFVTDVKGVLRENRLVDFLTIEAAEQLITDQVIIGGMIPKVKTALAVVQEGIGKVRIVSGKEPFFSGGRWIGTTFSGKAGVQA
ncbi:acetylglutamate kinase [Bacillus testis]|uniref:acetylglutamate kinase n=1 Tax=Bacillus testis TaxID=1622072 RepID=UPI00067ED1E3|nr:acetylglutamate kinase [Bacillus testis]